MKRKIAVEVICFLLAVLFSYAAANKLVDYQKFEVQIGLSPLLTGFRGVIPWIVISIEFVVSILLMIPRFRLYALFGAFCLMTIFTAYIVAILEYSSFVPCSCGGVLERLSWRDHLVFNIAFGVLGLVGIILQAAIDSKRGVNDAIQAQSV